MYNEAKKTCIHVNGGFPVYIYKQVARSVYRNSMYMCFRLCAARLYILLFNLVSCNLVSHLAA